MITVANWAYENNYTLRANGYMHTWSPLTVAQGNTRENVVLIDTTKNLVQMEMTTLSSNSATMAVKVQTGASMLNLLIFLEQNGFGLYTAPATGNIQCQIAIIFLKILYQQET